MLNLKSCGPSVGSFLGCMTNNFFYNFTPLTGLVVSLEVSTATLVITSVIDQLLACAIRLTRPFDSP